MLLSKNVFMLYCFAPFLLEIFAVHINYALFIWTLARSDACPPGNQTFTGSIPGPAHSFVEIWSWNYFYGRSLPTTDSSRELSVAGEIECALSTGYCNRLGILPRNSVVRFNWLCASGARLPKNPYHHLNSKLTQYIVRSVSTNDTGGS